jgi:hypothetical protein
MTGSDRKQACLQKISAFSLRQYCRKCLPALLFFLTRLLKRIKSFFDDELRIILNSGV